MSLPDPVPLSLLEGCSCLQIKNATIGFAVSSNSTSSVSTIAEAGADVQAKAPSTTNTVAAGMFTNNVGVKASTTASAGVSSSLGTKKVRMVSAAAAAAAAQPKVECTTVLENITLDAHQKSKIAILGKNGCGKR